MDQLFIQYYSDFKTDVFYMPLESLIICFVCKYVGDMKVTIHLIKSENKAVDVPTFLVNLNHVKYNILSFCDLYAIVKMCEFPSLLVKGKTLISGLCSVARQIIKCTNDDNSCNFKSLLGFRNACLLACNEVSVWTKFCEIDLPATVAQYSNSCIKENEIDRKEIVNIPIDVARYEEHLKQPIRIHNVYKIARELKLKEKFNCDSPTDILRSSVKTDISVFGDSIKCKSIKGSTLINSSIPIEDLNLGHLYAEGPFMTLADLILFPQLYIIFQKVGILNCKTIIPHVYEWFLLMEKDLLIIDAKKVIQINDCDITCLENVQHILPFVKSQSLYKSDPKRYKPQNRIYTKQEDIDVSLNIIEPYLNELMEPIKELFGSEMHLDWSEIPLEASPLGGALPECRIQRKCEQLENLAKAVLKLSKTGNKIIDFCSGSGHLGILLAYLLPDCEIVLLENKEESLNRAHERVERLKLKNIHLLQCNLDYFKGSFDIGVSLHACGVATDLVIEQCLKNRASFVSCPCCYGGVHDCHHIKYPRSRIFKQSDLSLQNYLVLGHSADQTHDKDNVKTKQGFKCMDVIDMDRILYAKEYGYEVKLGKLNPSTCTPKNNLLVGWYSNIKTSDDCL